MFSSINDTTSGIIIIVLFIIFILQSWKHVNILFCYLLSSFSNMPWTCFQVIKYFEGRCFFFGCLYGIQLNVWNVISLAKSLLLCISDVSNFYHCNKQCWDEHHCMCILWLFPLEKFLEEFHSQKDRTCFMWKLVGDIFVWFLRNGGSLCNLTTSDTYCCDKGAIKSHKTRVRTHKLHINIY